MEEGLARLEEEGELDAVEDGEGEEGEEWWLCWIRSGRWWMRPAKPFLSELCCPAGV